MSDSFELAGGTVRVPVPEGWAASVEDGRVNVRCGEGEGRPRATVAVAIRTAEEDLPATLNDEISTCAVGLTDYTILHIEPRTTRSGNWADGAPELPFVLGGFRQGILSLLMELGLVGADDTRAAVAYSLCMTEEAAALQEEMEAILAGIEVEWS